MMDLLWYQFIRDLVGGSTGLLGYDNKSGSKFCQNYGAQSALRDDYVYVAGRASGCFQRRAAQHSGLHSLCCTAWLLCVSIIRCTETFCPSAL